MSEYQYRDPKESESTDVRDAVKAGCLFYADPLRLDSEGIDPLIRPVVERINRSGWVWTAESCQGHPDDADPFGPWAGNTKPMLRLVCRTPRLGCMLAALMKATHRPGEAPLFNHRVPEHPVFLELYPSAYRDHVDPQRRWSEVLVYAMARTVGERNEGVAAFERFAELVSPEAR